jgi:tetratricopeptide (TPR) repeat protein
MVLGIAAIHAAGIIHRDIKPANVMLDRSGSHLGVSIMDFGLARLNEFRSAILGPNILAGTPGYLAPELIKGHLPSKASDIFALGVLLHQALTGDRPDTSADGFSLSPASSLKLAPVPSIYLHAIRSFLSEDPVSRCRAFEQVRSAIEERGLSHSELHESAPRWSRRQMLVASAAACCAAVGGTAWKYDRISEVFHPLPTKRFVALVGWPPPLGGENKLMLLGLIDSIATELSRAEAYDHNLFFIPHLSPADVNTPAQLNEVRESLGANLVLGTSVLRTSKALHASLQVLASPFTRAVRTRDIHVPVDQQTSLPRKAVHAAAEILGITHYDPDDKRLIAGTSNPEAFAAFQAAEALRKQVNDAGLEPAIERYKEAIDLDRHFSVAVANLAMAYCRLAFLNHDPAAISLARANAESALASDPNLVPAHMAIAFAYQQTGDEQAAIREMKKALALDPANPQTMIWQAQIYTRLNRWQDAEACYHRALRQRPNYWLAHNELGVVLNAQGRYSQAESEFRASNLANPKFALALSNIGAVCLQLGRIPEATAKLQQSLSLKPNALASANLSAALRSQGKLLPALGFARKATELDPEDSTTWLELGDCSSMIRGHEGEAKRAYREAARVQQEQLDTDATNGPGWILLALYDAKTGARGDARSHLRTADSFPSSDLDSQMYKARTLELLGSREEALAVLTESFKRGATPFQTDLASDMASLRKDPRYQNLLHRS